MHNPLSLAQVHHTTEEAIRATGIPYSFLRNNWYLENELGSVQAAMAGAPISTSAEHGKVGWAPRSDYAQAAAAVLEGDGHENTIYELSGKLASYDDLAAALSQVLGATVAVEHVDDVTYGERLAAAGVPDFLVPILVEYARHIREGALAVESNDFQKLLGRPATALPEALEQLAGRQRAGGTR